MESRNITYLSSDFPVFWESASGSTVTDIDGRRYLDLTAAFGVASLGHSPAAIRKAMAAQAAKLWHGMGDVHPSRVKVELLEALSALYPGGRGKTILSSSGAEAVESALKTARLATGKKGVIYFEGAYHGLTYGALATTARRDFRDPFANQLGRFSVKAPYPDSLRGPDEDACLDAVKTLLAQYPIGAILVEPVQARGGSRVPKPFFLRELAHLAAANDALLIADEIYTGLGRTGKTLAVEHSGVAPDLLCLGKALANGFPISACVGSSRVMDAWPESDGEAIHTSTFLGNPLGCAMAVASLREMKRLQLPQKAERSGRLWLESLREALGDYPRVGEIRGQGLMVGIELVKDRQSLTPDPALAGRLVTQALARGLLILSGGNARNVLTLTPPLTISQSDLSRSTPILKEILDGTTTSPH